MPRLAWFRAAVLVAALLALRVPDAAAQKAGDGELLSFTPPVEVLGFRLTNQQSSPEAGAELRYQQPGRAEWIDVYVYPATVESPCDRACDSVAAHTQTDGFKALIPELLRRGYYDSLRVEGDERVGFESGGKLLSGRHVRLRGGRAGAVISSQFYLVPAGVVLVKVRATYPPAAQMDSSVDRFAHAFVRTALQRTRSCEGGEPSADGIEMTVTLASPLAGVRERVPAALRKLGYELEPGGEPDTWRTLPVRDWPARGDWGTLRNKPHPGVRVWVAAETKGDGTELRVGAEPLCGVPQEREVETAAALIAATEVMMEFPEARKQ